MWHIYIIWSAQHFESDLNLYNTDIVDYTKVIYFFYFIFFYNKTPDKGMKTYIYNETKSSN